MACKACNELCRLHRITSFSALRLVNLTVVSLIGCFGEAFPQHARTSVTIVSLRWPMKGEAQKALIIFSIPGDHANAIANPLNESSPPKHVYRTSTAARHGRLGFTSNASCIHSMDRWNITHSPVATLH